MRKVSDFEKHFQFQSQCEEEKQWVLQLELELLQAEKEAELVVMASSRGGKHSSKGKSKSNMSDTTNKKPEVFNSKLALAPSSNNPDGLRISRTRILSQI